MNIINIMEYCLILNKYFNDYGRIYNLLNPYKNNINTNTNTNTNTL